MFCKFNEISLTSDNLKNVLERFMEDLLDLSLVGLHKPRALSLAAHQKRAAVAIIMRPQGRSHELLLMKRAEWNGDPW